MKNNNNNNNIHYRTITKVYICDNIGLQQLVDLADFLAVNGKQILLKFIPIPNSYLQHPFRHQQNLQHNSNCLHLHTGNGRFVFSLHIVEKLLEVVAVVAHPQAIYIALKQFHLMYFSSCHLYCPRTVKPLFIRNVCIFASEKLLTEINFNFIGFDPKKTAGNFEAF